MSAREVAKMLRETNRTYRVRVGNNEHLIDCYDKPTARKCAAHYAAKGRVARIEVVLSK